MFFSHLVLLGCGFQLATGTQKPCMGCGEMDQVQENVLDPASRQGGSGPKARFQPKGRKASALAGGLATAASLLAASAVGSDPLVF